MAKSLTKTAFSVFNKQFLHISYCVRLSATKAAINSMDLKTLPKLVVFDLDQCLWSPEMYTLSVVPTKDHAKLGNLGDFGDGAIGVCSGREVIQLFPGALKVLQDFYLDKYPGMRIAAASSADTPLAVRIGKAAMNILEILPGVTMRMVFAKGWDDGYVGNIQIGRTPPLSSDKASTHFPILREATNVEYKDMLFFDDCLWGDHCGRVEKHCPGVVAVRTPDGLGEKEWLEGLKKYSQRYS